MGNKFNDFGEFCKNEKKVFEGNVKEEAGGLALSSIVETLDIDSIARDVAKSDCYSFRDGDGIAFSIPRYSFNIVVAPDEMLVRLGYNFEVVRYEGKEVSDFYNELSSKIKREFGGFPSF